VRGVHDLWTFRRKLFKYVRAPKEMLHDVQYLTARREESPGNRTLIPIGEASALEQVAQGFAFSSASSEWFNSLSRLLHSALEHGFEHSLLCRNLF
jgi:hypothetical protein